MPDLPHISGHEILRTLKKLSCEAIRQNSSHVRVRRQTAQRTFFSSVPLHKIVKEGTLSSILSDLEIDGNDFIAAYKRKK